MNPFPLGPLHECQNHLRREFLDFATQWQTTRAQWRDEPARLFEQQFLTSLAPSLQRVSASASDLADQIRAADRALADPERMTDS